MRRTSFILIAVVGSFAMSLPAAARASSLFLELPQAVPSEFSARIMLRLGEPLSGIGGRLVFDPRRVELLTARPAPGSHILWTEEPKASGNSELVFSGIFPGGLTPAGLQDVPLVEARFRARAVGSVGFSFSDVQAFLSGPQAKSARIEAPGRIAYATADTAVQLVADDLLAPEPFEILVIRDPRLSEGKRVLLFDPVDKGSGIAYTEVRERFLGFLGDWEGRESPAQLSHQSLYSIIEVRATDMRGNVRTEQMVPKRLVAAWAAFGLALLSLLYMGGRRIVKRQFL